jgi:predicted transcriptional regulator
MKTTEPINTRTARDYWNLVQKTDDDATTPQDAAIMDDDDEWWKKAYLAEPVEPYTTEEINAMIEEGERDFAEGRSFEASEVIAELRAEFARELEMEHKLAVAV